MALNIMQISSISGTWNEIKTYIIQLEKMVDGLASDVHSFLDITNVRYIKVQIHSLRQ